MMKEARTILPLGGHATEHAFEVTEWLCTPYALPPTQDVQFQPVVKYGEHWW